MSLLKSVVTLALLISGSAMSSGAAPTPQATSVAHRQLPCVVLPAGNYVIQSVTINPGVPLVAGPVSAYYGGYISMESNPTNSNLGTWKISPADQGGFHILNVGLGLNVTTHFEEEMEYSYYYPMLGIQYPSSAATTYAIECAGGGEYVIKSVDADQLWTPASTYDPTFSVQVIDMVPSTGSRIQHWNFIPA